MHSCDYIRGFKGKPEVPVSSSNLINKILQRNGSDKQQQQHSHHKSHEVLLTERDPESSQNCEDKNYIARHDKNKRHSRSEDNLLDLVQKITNPSANGQVILTQDFFMQPKSGDPQKPRLDNSGKFDYGGSSKELPVLGQSSPSTTSTEELDQIDSGSGRRLNKDSREELTAGGSSDPDYPSDEGEEEERDRAQVPRLDLTELRKKLTIDEKMMPPLQSPTGSTDNQGLIVPKKLINPCLESMDRQNLHRELMFNNKTGRSVLNQKSELQRVLDKQKERQFLAAQQQQQQQQQMNGVRDSLGGELGRVIMQRAQRLESLQNSNQPNQDEELKRINPEYVNARAKLKATAAGGAYDCK